MVKNVSQIENLWAKMTRISEKAKHLFCPEGGGEKALYCVYVLCHFGIPFEPFPF